MHEAFLLLALERIIGRKEIGNQNAGKATQHLWEERAFPRRFVEVVNLV